MKKILIIDDEIHIVELLKFNLENNGYKVDYSYDGFDGYLKTKEFEPDLILLDWMLPNISGIDLLKKIRSDTALEQIPVIMLTAKGEVFDKVLALELGADDYVVKPFEPKELLARVKAVTRRYSPEVKNNDVIKFNDLTIDIGAYEVVYKNNIVKLAPKELELLHYMASSPNKVFTREQLMYEVWGYDYPGDSRTVDVHIKRLREKLKGGETWEVQTVWGVGYKFEVK